MQESEWRPNYWNEADQIGLEMMIQINISKFMSNLKNKKSKFLKIWSTSSTFINKSKILIAYDLRTKYYAQSGLLLKN